MIFYFLILFLSVEVVLPGRFTDEDVFFTVKKESIRFCLHLSFALSNLYINSIIIKPTSQCILQHVQD